MSDQGPILREARWPEDAAAATALLRSYAAYLGANPSGAANICIANYEEELAGLAVLWSEPKGVLLLAFLGDEAVGCVALKIRGDRPGAVEMKRLWVPPAGRGHGLGRRLALAAMEWSRGHGFGTILLDTVPEAMPEAAALYRALGFQETQRHNDNAVPGLVFFERTLADFR